MEVAEGAWKLEREKEGREIKGRGRGWETGKRRGKWIKRMEGCDRMRG